MRVLVVNAGSSSLKLRLLDEHDEILQSHDLREWDGEAGALVDVAGAWRFDAVGHRVVHGGADFTGPTVVDDVVVRRIDGLSSLAPLHQPRALAGIDAARRAFEDVPSVACFDTAFHAAMPDAASTYAVPQAWRDRWPIRRFGFHGLSHAYAARRTATLLDEPVERLRLLTCHLGAGSSLCAVRAGTSVDTTMGFTPLEGLVMATRSGTVDPGLVLWLIRVGGLAPDEVGDGLERGSGLAALAGTARLEEVLARAAEGEQLAAAAIDVYVHRLAREMGAMVASMRGVDAVAFTGGVGENAAIIRSRAVDALAHLGARIDEGLNRSARPDARLEAEGSRVAVVLVESREDVEIAGQVRTVCGPSTKP